MPLSIVTPTRRRWHWLRKQARAIAGQLAPDDCWIIVVDNDQPNQRVVNEIAELVPARQLTWLNCSYIRPTPPTACVNRLRNAATTLVPARHDIVEVDDHDVLTPHALAEIRLALAAGYDYVFGWYQQVCQLSVARRPLQSVTTPNQRTTGHGQLATDKLEPWPDVRHRYTRGAFERREIDGIGVRAFKRWLWTRLGGWATHVWPGGDYHFAVRAEAIGAKIVCLEQPLCTVTIEAESISGSNRRWKTPRAMTNDGMTE